MSFNKISLALAVVVILGGLSAVKTWVTQEGYHSAHEPPKLWVEVHDVSPGYGVEKLREITDILERHRRVAEKVVLFVIPNHAGVTPLSSYPEFVSVLKNLSEEGFILGIHGYTHREPEWDPEFNTDVENAKKLIEASRQEFRKAGLVPARYFAPPNWYASAEVSPYLREEFDFVYYAFSIDTPSGPMPYPTHEYTWYNIDFGGIKKAEKDFLQSKGVFRLTIHVGAANSPKNLEFLEQFLSWVEEQYSEG